MAESIFSDKDVSPDSEALSSILGKSEEFLNLIVSFLDENCDDFRMEWKYYGAKTGWLLKLFSGKRNVLFVVPSRGGFRVALTFGEAGCKKIIDGEFSKSIKQMLAEARKYAEGRSIQIDVRSQRDAEDVCKLINVKLDH